MGKLTTYMIVMSGLILLFYFTGLFQQCGDDGLCENKTPNSALLQLLISPKDMPNQDVTDTSQEAILVLEGVAAVAISVGLWFSGKPELALIAPFALYLFNLGWDFIYIFLRVSSVNPVLAILFISPLLFLYIITIVEWWRGRD